MEIRKTIRRYLGAIKPPERRGGEKQKKERELPSSHLTDKAVRAAQEDLQQKQGGVV